MRLTLNSYTKFQVNDSFFNNFFFNTSYFLKAVANLLFKIEKKNKQINKIKNKTTFFKNFLLNFITNLFNSKVCLNIFFLKNKTVLETQLFYIFINYYKYLYGVQFKSLIFFVKAFLILLVFKDLNFFKN